MKLSVREMKENDIAAIVNYFCDASPDFLLGMGANKALLPNKKMWMKAIHNQLAKPYTEKEIYYTIWQADGQPIGHSNINKIRYGIEANMHLHMWHGQNRKKGVGGQLVKESIACFFTHFNLQRLLCEPYTKNPAPAKTLPGLGFEFEKEYETIPGAICFPQKVKRFVLSREKWNGL